ncbi:MULTISPECIES: DUF3885 domain-containing protein [unclassified Brevundimonas]|uniref:DUF3885 domain-containing protein n=1 Tax=unclassified Brevundimonas TaxID=2622653 RepID=UPI000CFBE59F|nr:MULTISPECIES: DUF3885 domain-containing protein [unclassified Brevundimonas]PRA35273.1 hypothetical protein CQ024_02340 [Brevundimonas sp. MYb27]PQZ82979.1 hypothetical protein CQ026_06995 [Brevundimonas sp. MYb31]PRB14996.1 hypothetical protein CQ039_08980 [Brevundimonas sp. MYb52]PRB36901.1 hypothetical protein CQ035_04435 [Brevundimonas sp. MYb46]PRB52207.1 hypothetical protein CQ028_06545 [Brevundimonas sp. MYb33]
MAVSGKSPLARIESAFGCAGFPDALFYEFPNALRFELAGDQSRVATSFFTATDRIRGVARDLFAQSDRLTAVVSFWEQGRDKPKPSRPLGPLKELGFTAPFGRCCRVLEEDFSADEPAAERLWRCWRTAEFSPDAQSLDALAWASIAWGPIAPQPSSIAVYIVDFERRIALHPYDDRGMDVIGMSPQSLKPIYDRHRAWLLSFDQDRMDAVFG